MAVDTYYLKIKLDFNNYTIHILLYNLRPEGKDYVLPNTNFNEYNMYVRRIYHIICIDNI